MMSLPSRGAIGLASGVLAGVVSAGLFGVAFTRAETMLVFLAYLSAVPLFMAGLGSGIVSGALAALIGIAGLVTLRPLDFSLFYAIVMGLPAAGLIVIALYKPVNAETTAEGNMLTAITLYPCVIFLAVVAAVSGTPGGLLGLTTDAMITAGSAYKDALDTDTYAWFLTTIKGVAKMLPGALGLCWMFIMLLSAVVAQASLAQQKWNLRPSFALKDVCIPNWLVFAAAITGLAGAFAPAPYNYVGTNICVMLFVPFFLVGLAVVHAWAATTKARVWILVVFYILLSLPWTMVFAAVATLLLGIVDQWVNFRQRFAVGVKKGE